MPTPTLPARERRGFTLLELIIIMMIVALLFAMLLPAIRSIGPSSRGAARRTQCLNNLHNLSLAMQGYATTHNGFLPPLGDGAGCGWPVALLPYVDRPDLHQRYLQSGALSPTDRALMISVFVCPNDLNNFRQPGGFSYPANCGAGDFTERPDSLPTIQGGGHDGTNIDWDRNGLLDDIDADIARDTGVIWAPAGGFAMTLDRISEGDGVGQTLLLAENMNAGDTTQTGWSNPSVSAVGFVFGIRPEAGTTPTAFGPPSGVTPDNALQIPPTAANDFDAVARIFRPSPQTHSAWGARPIPVSNHSGVFNVAFCDGRSTSISDEIDPRVWARLMSSGGTRRGQLPLLDNDY